MPNVFVTFALLPQGLEILHKKGFRVDVNKTGWDLSKNQLKEVFGKYDAVITLVTDKIDQEIIDSASSRLKIISNYGVGYDNIDAIYARRRGIVVTNTPGVAGGSVAEHTFALIFAVNKSLIEADKYVRTGKYNKWDPKMFLSHELWGQTIGIVGLGKIGTYVGHIAYGGFKMNILYHDIVRSEDFELLTEAKFTNLNTLLRNSDIVTLHVPLNAKTKHLIGKREFREMKDSAILINTSRGQVVDEDSLIWALETGKIVGAGIDVYEHEPSVPHALTALPNVVLTPHIASATWETREEMARIAAQNVADVFSGKTPFGIVKVD